MKIKTLITTILLGTSTMAAVASAHPAQASYGEQTWSSSSRDHRTNQNQGRTQPAPDNDNGYYFRARFGGDFDPGYRRDLPPPSPYQALASVPVVGGQQETWLQGQRAASLRIDVTRGSVYVSKIGVELADHQKLVLPVNRTLSPGTASDPLIDLAGARDILRVIVYTPNGGNGAAYNIVSC